MSLKSRIFELLENEYPAWIPLGRIERLAMELGYLGSNAGRRARDLIKEGKIEHDYNSKGCVSYRFKVEKHQADLI